MTPAEYTRTKRDEYNALVSTPAWGTALVRS